MRADYRELYTMTEPGATRPWRLADGRKDIPTNRQVHDLAKGRITPIWPVELCIYQGSSATDVLWTRHPTMVCISDRVRNLLGGIDATGWDTYLVVIKDRSGAQVFGYSGLAVTGPICKRQPSRSKTVTRKRPSPKGREYQAYLGLYFDETQWDGSDFFWVLPSGGIVVTQRVRDLFVAEKVTNVRLTSLLEVERDVLLDKYDKLDAS